MLMIRTIDDLKLLEQKQALPKWYLNHLREFFLVLFTAYQVDTELEEFSLEGVTDILILEPEDNVHDLRIPMIYNRPKLMDMMFEYVGKLPVDGHEIYRIMFMPDKTRLIFIFSIVGQFSAEVEQWLAQQYTWSEIRNLTEQPGSH